MPRRKLIRQSDFPYHVTTRNNRKDWFQIPMADVWEVCKQALIYASKSAPVEINCFVLMSNHYHLLITTPGANIDRFMMLFNLSISRKISQRSGMINHKFANGYKWSIVDNNNYLANVYRYIYQNPVRARLVTTPTHYPYSSLFFSRNESKLINYRPHFDYRSYTKFFNKSYNEDFDEVIRKSLRRPVFKPSSRISKFNKYLMKDGPSI